MAKKRILVVDDTEDITSTLKMYLEKTGAYEVRVENCGANALQATREFKPDLIFLDVVMPDMDGGDVAEQIEHDAELKDTKIVLLTASVSKQEESVLGGTLGGRPLMSKQTKLKEIVAFLQKHLGP